MRGGLNEGQAKRLSEFVGDGDGLVAELAIAMVNQFDYLCYERTSILQVDMIDLC